MGKLTQEQRNKFYSVIHEDMKYSASYSESYGEKTLEELRQLSNQLEKKGYHLVDCMMIGPRTLREHLTDWGYNLDSMDKTTVLGMGAYLYDYSKKFEPVHRHTYEKKYPPVITFLKRITLTRLFVVMGKGFKTRPRTFRKNPGIIFVYLPL